MDIYVYKKEFFRESPDVRATIVLAAEALYGKIAVYESHDIPFGKIFNDDHVKYDKNGDFYTFKFSRSNIQLRLLYTYLIIEGNSVMLIADYAIKKKNNKNYIKQFEYAKTLNAIEVFEQSKMVKRI